MDCLQTQLKYVLVHSSQLADYLRCTYTPNAFGKCNTTRVYLHLSCIRNSPVLVATAPLAAAAAAAAALRAFCCSCCCCCSALGSSSLPLRCLALLLLLLLFAASAPKLRTLPLLLLLLIICCICCCCCCWLPLLEGEGVEPKTQTRASAGILYSPPKGLGFRV